MFTKLLRFATAIILILLLAPFNYTNASCSTPSAICGYAESVCLTKLSCTCAFVDIKACSNGERIGWNVCGGIFGPEGYVRINDPVIVDIAPVTLPDGTVIKKMIKSWSSSSDIPGCNACDQVPTQLPTQIPTNTRIPPTATQIPPTLSPIPTSTSLPPLNFTPPNVRLTDFTLADTLSSFSNFQIPIVLQPNTLWIQITNVGQSPFYPPGGSGQYTLQVILKKLGGKLEEYDYVSGDPTSLAQLGNLEPGQSINYFIPDLFFFTPIDNAELEVFFSPDASLGMQNSILSKSVSVQENPDSFQRCVGTVAQAMVGAVEIDCPECRAALAYPDLAIGTLKCGADSSCIAEENTKWLIGVALGPIQDAGKLLSLAADALTAMDEPPSCMIVSDWLNAYLREAIRNKYLLNAITTESPVYPLATDDAGQQAGFLENGQIIEDIPGSKVVVLGEQRYILYPGTDSTRLSIIGYADGKMNLYATYTQSPGQGKSIRFNNINITQGMKATLSSLNSQYMLEIDTNGDGTTDQSLPPDEIQAITENGAIQQPITTPIASPVLANNQEIFIDSSGGGLGIVLVIVLLVIGGVSIPVIRSRAMKKVAYSAIPNQAILVSTSGLRWNITSDNFIIGRSSSCSLRLNDPSVSRQHARIRYGEDRWYIQDLNSAHGTYVNGVRVNAIALNNGDHIRICSTEFEFRV